MTKARAKEAAKREIRRLVDPLVAAAESEYRFRELMAVLGWHLAGIPEITDIKAAISAAIELLELALDSEPPENLKAFVDQIKDIGNGFKGISKLDLSGVAEVDLSDLPADIAEILLVQYLIKYRPILWQFLQLPGITVDKADAVVTPGQGTPGQGIFRAEHRRARLKFKQIGDLLSNPEACFANEYPGDAAAKAEKVFPRIQALLTALNVPSLYGLPDGIESILDNDEAKEMASRSLSFRLPPTDALGNETTLGAVAQLIDSDSGVALALLPFGAAPYAFNIGQWQIDGTVSGITGGFAIDASGVTFADISEENAFSAKVSAKRRNDDDEPIVRIGGEAGTRLEIGSFEARGNLNIAGKDADWGILARADDSLFALSAGDGDGFIRKIFPDFELEIPFDLGIGYDSKRGIYLEGGADLEADITVNLNLLDTISVHTAHLGLTTEPGGQLGLSSAISARVDLGAIKMSIEKIGLMADIEFPVGGGNLGPADIALKFKPPTGGSLSVEAEMVSGGGYLSHDVKLGRYAGILNLEAPQISITAVGLITIKDPDGYSLLILASGEFPPIQLGFGFTLSGLGGLLGLNRTMAAEELRSRVKSGAVDSILFPEDPLKNPAKLISDLAAIFPPAERRFLIGPMLIINFGTPAIVSAEIGVFVELPKPIRLAILGQISLTLPNEEAPVVLLRLDVAGILDFERKEASIDATLFDSHIAGFPVTGDMAMRLRWGEDPVFIMSAGGFHPAFAPPPGFPALNRMAISLTKNKPNPRLRVESYFAITSNTVQFGAALDAYAEKDTKFGLFSVEAYFSFDTLIQLKPFGVIVDLAAGAALKKNGKSVLSVSFRLTVTGPGPWTAKGHVSFKFVVKFKIPIDVSVGKSAGNVPVIAADPGPELRAALAADENWSFGSPISNSSGVMLRAPKSGQKRAHPASALSVRQRVLPLDEHIVRIGNAELKSPKSFEISGIDVDGKPVTPARLSDHFAAAQYLNLSDAEKLSAPQFQLMSSGASVEPDGFAMGDGVEIDQLVERKVVDKPKLQFIFLNDLPFAQRPAVLSKLSAYSAAAISSNRFFSEDEIIPMIEITEQAYAIVDGISLQGMEAGSYFKAVYESNAARVVPMAEVQNQ
ncbi:DUF6603 domain-containing protein [Hyphobacterium sp.]|uniref:DUF6603 domain-containing protein n=1 Tax=Hyphobacterium sp. TaxID=2004662 RepID=UPI003BAD2CB8